MPRYLKNIFNLNPYILELSKLDLGDLSKADGLTDASFSEVFRHMELYEFRLASTTPLTSVRSVIGF